MNYTDKYQIVNEPKLGSGGNGNVFKVQRKSDGKIFALKELKTTSAKKVRKVKRMRFEDEIKTLLICKKKQIRGVIPVIDYSYKKYWYVMPIAEGIVKYISSIEDVVNCILSISETLIELHTQGLSHRDIKPDNILYYNGSFVLSDFGLVGIPDNPHNLTKDEVKLGAIWTIAPEMKRNPYTADGKKADVYSLAKTLWILLTNNDKGFEGVYDYNNPSVALSKNSQLRAQHIAELEILLNKSTQHDPEVRPTMVEFKEYLIRWKKIKDNQFLRSESNWNFLLDKLFVNSMPSTCIWKKFDDIFKVLTTVMNVPCMNYMFFPSFGDLDIENIIMSTEEGCVDIITYPYDIYRIKPARLICETFALAAWNYFLLELEEQKNVVGDDCSEYEECVVEDTPGHYVSDKAVQYGVYDYDTGIELPKGYKEVTRCLKGKLLIVPKFGPYNFINGDSDGRHSRCSSEEFRSYVENLQAIDSHRGALGDKETDRQLEFAVKNCSFRGDEFISQSVSEYSDQDSNSQKTDEDLSEGLIDQLSFSEYVNFDKAYEGFCSYSFSILQSPGILLKDKIAHVAYYLCRDGMVRKLKSDDSLILKIENMNDAQILYKSLLGKAEEYKQELHILSINWCIHVSKVKFPSHMFSLKELETLMSNADDRENNTLVIGGDGYPYILKENKKQIFYPVIHETWCAGRKYVGKYSNLKDLASTYHYCLGKWLDYLQLGEGQQLDDYDRYGESTSELETKIQKLYVSAK